MESYKVAAFFKMLTVLGMICGSITDKSPASTHWHCGNSNLKWPSHYISWRAGTNSFPPGSPRRTALKFATHRWNEAPGGFMFYAENWGDQHVGRGNGQNEIWFSTNASLLNGAPAVCFTEYSCSSSDIEEADVVFNNNVAWTTSDEQTANSPYGGPRRPWGTTAIHEMGHALGLAHEDDTYNVMGQDWDHIHANNGEVRCYVGEDAGNGEVHLYGQTLSTLKNDVGVVHWKHTGHSGEYSTHGPCGIYHLDYSGVTGDYDTGWKRYKVTAGQVYKVQFTYENNGYYHQTGVQVAYYISTNDWITTYDRLIGVSTFTMKRNKAFTHAIDLLIPYDLTLGQTYYLGVVVDYTESIIEYCEKNNATWIPIRIVLKARLP
ncbi:MAG: matrixin family metalloprotease [Phycisphaerales bacterium]|nr:MAG: matrixin family metalloprotease [Phycisphaerales bacterium]